MNLPDMFFDGLPLFKPRYTRVPVFDMAVGGNEDAAVVAFALRDARGDR